MIIKLAVKKPLEVVELISIQNLSLSFERRFELNLNSEYYPNFALVIKNNFDDFLTKNNLPGILPTFDVAKS